MSASFYCCVISRILKLCYNNPEILIKKMCPSSPTEFVHTCTITLSLKHYPSSLHNFHSRHLNNFPRPNDHDIPDNTMCNRTNQPAYTPQSSQQHRRQKISRGFSVYAKPWHSLAAHARIGTLSYT